MKALARAEATAEISRLAGGLPADHGGQQRLLERIAAHVHAELLRDLLVEAGALAVLEAARVKSNPKGDAAMPSNPPYPPLNPARDFPRGPAPVPPPLPPPPPTTAPGVPADWPNPRKGR